MFCLYSTVKKFHQQEQNVWVSSLNSGFFTLSLVDQESDSPVLFRLFSLLKLKSNDEHFHVKS